MMNRDKRIRKIAENVLKNSVNLKKGERIYIEVIGRSGTKLFKEFINVATEMGAIPFYHYNDEGLQKEFISSASKEQMKAYAKIHQELMKDSDVYIAIRGYDDVFELAGVDEKQVGMFHETYHKMVHKDIRVPQTRWCVMRYPNNAFAALARMPLEDFEEFYFNAVLVDYSKMDKAMDPLKKLMDKTDKVKIIAPGTELEFSIKDLKGVKCSGSHNIPDGEVYTAPVKNSINGHIQFNTETSYMGTYFSNIYLEFKKGKIVAGKSQANDEAFQKILDLDKGSRYIGEFALGVNPYVTKPILDILFDEKISGSLHMAIGSAYEGEAFNGNMSAVHWDLVLMQDKQSGGGEIYFDDVLIRKDGLFVLKELEGLNPKNLK